jgi:low affinity Fe/Cu permease
VSEAHNSFVGIEHLTDEELKKFALNASGPPRRRRRTKHSSKRRASGSKKGPSALANELRLEQN